MSGLLTRLSIRIRIRIYKHINGPVEKLKHYTFSVNFKVVAITCPFIVDVFPNLETLHRWNFSHNTSFNILQSIIAYIITFKATRSNWGATYFTIYHLKPPQWGWLWKSRRSAFALETCQIFISIQFYLAGTLTPRTDSQFIIISLAVCTLPEAEIRTNFLIIHR